MHRYDTEIAQGEVAAALVSAMKGTQMGPPIFNVIPRTLLERLTTAMMASEEKKAGSQDVTMRMLAPTLHYDFQLATEWKALSSGSTESAPRCCCSGAARAPHT